MLLRSSCTNSQQFRIRLFPTFERNSPSSLLFWQSRSLRSNWICKSFSQLSLTSVTLPSDLWLLLNIGAFPKVNMRGLDRLTNLMSPVKFETTFKFPSEVYVHAVGLSDQLDLKRRIWKRQVSAIHICIPFIIESSSLMYFISCVLVWSSIFCVSLSFSDFSWLLVSLVSIDSMMVCWLLCFLRFNWVLVVALVFFLVEYLVNIFGFRFLQPIFQNWKYYKNGLIECHM